MIHIIKEGKHFRDTIWYYHKFIIGNSISGTFCYLEGAIYDDLDPEGSNGDTNKLVGLSDALSHKNCSIRIGTRWNLKKNRFEARWVKHEFFKISTGFIAWIDFPEDCNSFFIEANEGYYTVQVNGIKTYVDRYSKYKGPRYCVLPYFGGDPVAPIKQKVEVIFN